MKRLGWLVLVIFLLTNMLTTSFAVEVILKDGIYDPGDIPDEPIVTPDPRAVLTGSEETDYIENDQWEDAGTVWVEWNDTAYATYGCSTANINYTNPNRSNIGVTLSVGIFDGDMIKYFGTTFRTEDELLEFGMMGYDALQNGINRSNADYLVAEGGIFEGMDAEEISMLDKDGLCKLLAEQAFMGMTEDELMNLTEEDVKALDEIDKLTLAQLGGYNFYTYYMVIGEAGVINPGYTLYQVDLYTLPGQITIPKGEYKAVFVLNGYDAKKNELSKFFIHLPITLVIEEDLPEDLQKEYGVTLATRID